jgi:hypothetical protein
MKIDKRLLFAGLAVAIAMFAVTASASAAVWKDKGVSLTKSAEIPLTGGEVFETGTAGMSCELAVTLVAEVGSMGTITKYETKKCSGGFGELSKCELASAEAIGLPWTVDVNATDLTITNLHTRRVFKAGCKIAELDKTVASVTVTLDNAAAISEMEFVGSIVGYKTFGSFTVSAPNAGTYGIG